MKLKFNINGKEYNAQISKENDKIIKIIKDIEEGKKEISYKNLDEIG